MNVLMVHSRVKAESVAEVEAAIEDVFSAIEEAKPVGVRYTSSMLADGVTFVRRQNSRTGSTIPSGPARIRGIQENLKKWMAEPAAPEQMTVVGSYRLC